MPKVKFQDVDETQQFKVIPEGDYVAEIVKVEETKTKNDDDMWKVQFKVIEGEHTGTSIFSYFVFNEGGYGNIKKLYKDIESLYNQGKLKAIKRVESPQSTKYGWCHVDSFQTNSKALVYFIA